MSFPGLLDSIVNFTREVRTDDGQGGQTVTWSIFLRRVPCRFESLAEKFAGAQSAYAKLTPMPDFLVYAEYQGGVREGDRIVDSKGNVYGISLKEDWSLQGRYMKLAVTEIKRGV
jgi:hypothetical protein